MEREARRAQLERIKNEAYQTYKNACRHQKETKLAHDRACSDLINYVHCDSEERKKNPERRTFVAACPTEECRGFLSTHYKCGTCLKSFCSSCRELKEEGHACNPDVVETLKVIAKESRACPGCGMAISRVSGCDQMYCTQCDVAFSYSTGLRVQGVIHNPHYFERLRQMQAKETLNGRGEIGEAVNFQARRHMEQACGAWPLVSSMDWLPQEEMAMITSLHQTGTNMEHYILPIMARFNRRYEDNADLRVRYCLNDLDERRFKLAIERRERKREFDVDVMECLQLFVILAMEACYGIVALFGSRTRVEEARTLLEDYMVQIKELVIAPLLDIKKRFKIETPKIQFPDSWTQREMHTDMCRMPARKVNGVRRFARQLAHILNK